MENLPLVHFNMQDKRVVVLLGENRWTFELGEMVLGYVNADFLPFYKKTAAPSKKEAAEIIAQLGDLHVYFELFTETLQDQAETLNFYVGQFHADIAMKLETCFDVQSSRRVIGDTAAERYGNYRRNKNIAKRHTVEVRWSEGKLAEYYEPHSIEELCQLEIRKLAVADVSMKKCLNCHELFILKGGYSTEFCSRVPAGETRTCQAIGAAKNYRKKFEDSPALRMYSKYYKRNYSRIRYGLMSRETFNSWKAEAVRMRDDCADGLISLEEFDAWLKWR